MVGLFSYNSKLYIITGTPSATTIDIMPPLRDAASAATVDFTLPNGTWRMASNDIGWSINNASIYGFSFSCVEGNLMARGITSAMTSLALGGEVKPLLLVEALFDSNAPSSYIYLWNGIGDLSHDSKTYIGAGDLLSISTIQESVELQANSVTLQLAGVGDPLLSKAKTENYQGREVNIKLGGFDASNSIIADPVIVFSGFMDTMTITDDGQIGTISLTG